MFKALEILPSVVSSLQTISANHAGRQNTMEDITKEKVNTISSISTIILGKSQVTVDTLGRLRKQATQSINTLVMIARDIRVILLRLKALSKEFSNQVVLNT